MNMFSIEFMTNDNFPDQGFSPFRNYVILGDEVINNLWTSQTPCIQIVGLCKLR